MISTNSGIYKIVNKANGKLYVGSALNLRKRCNTHFNFLSKKIHSNRFLQNSYNKHGKEIFEFAVIEFVDDPSLLIIREQFYIDTYKSFDRLKGYNISPTAGNNLGMKSPCKGVPKSQEFKDKVTGTVNPL